MNDTVFDPTNKILAIKRDTDNVELWYEEDMLGFCAVEGCDKWPDNKVLAYFYLEARVVQGCIANEQYNESIFTLILNTLKTVTGQDDFVTTDWEGLKYECVEYTTPQPVYSSFTTTDGYDLTLRYMTPGLAWQELVVRHDETLPDPADLYSHLTGEREQEWVSNGSIHYDGVTYSFDQAASAVFTVKRRLQIHDSNNDLIYSDSDFTGVGIIDALMGLHRQFQLAMNYGQVATLTSEQHLMLQNNVVHLLIDMFGMGDYMDPQDGTSHSIRGVVTPDVQCLISHTFMAESGRIRADFRFFTLAQNWTVERHESFVLGEETAVDVVAVYNNNAGQIRMALGLDLPEPEINHLADIPFENRDMGALDPTMQPFTPLTPEEEAAYYADQDEQPAGDPLLVTMVVAVGPSGGIGMGNDLLFKTKEDMQFFKRVTSDHVVIMGRKTFESIGRPLPNRQNIVVTSDPEYVLNLYNAENDQQHDNLHCVTSIEEAVALGGRLALGIYGNNELMVIGGGSIYQEFMPMTSRILLTSFNVDDSHADVFFPLSGTDIQAGWHAAVINESLEEDGITYARYELTRK